MNIVLLRFYSCPTPHYDRLAASLRARGHIAWVGTLSPEARFEWHDGRRVIAVQAGPRPAPNGLQRWHLLASVYKRIAFLIFIFGIRKFLQATRPEIVHVDPSCMYWVWLLPLFMPAQTRFILHFCQLLQRGDTGLLASLRSLFDNWGRQFCVRYIYHRACFITPAGAKRILGVRWPQWATAITLGVDSRFLSIQPVAPIARDDEPVRFIYLGVLSRVRQLERLLTAIQTALAVTDKFQVTFIGPDAAQGFYHNLARQLGLWVNVTMGSPVPYEDVPTTCSSYHVALAYIPDRPPDWQYYPTLKVQEYRALGLPIIASDFEPNRQIVQEGINGLLVPNTSEAWARAFTTFTIDRNFLRDCQTNARTMRQGTTWNEVARIWEQNVYNVIAATIPSSSRARHRTAH